MLVLFGGVAPAVSLGDDGPAAPVAGPAPWGVSSWLLHPPTARPSRGTSRRQRTDVVGIFPDRASIIRLVGSLVIGETEECAEQRRYVSAEALAKVQRVGFADARAVADDGTEHALPASMTA
jgi:hypothetical protein